MLIKCPECGLQISDKAVACPHCGYPMKSDTISVKPRKRNNKRRRLPNGFGQISEIKNRNLRKPFRAMITVGKTSTGKLICKPLKPESYFSTYNDAYAALVEYNKNPYDLKPTITVKELYEEWTKEHFKHIKPSSARSIKAAWSYCSAVYNMHVKDLRGRHIKSCMEEGYITIKDTTKYPSAVIKALIKSLFNCMLDYATEYEIVDRNYARTFKLSKDLINEKNKINKEHIPFTEEEIKILWDNVEKMQYVDIILIQCYSGWRPQELGKIEVANVNLKNWTYKGGMKTDFGSDRIVPIHPKIRSLVIKNYEKAKELGSEFLFNYTINGEIKNLDYYRYKKAFIKIRDELKLKADHRPHDGRKHFVTMAKKFNVDEFAIKYMVGHSITDLTEKVYTKREITWLNDEIKKIK